MRKQEFLRELNNVLEGRISDHRKDEILREYENRFEEGWKEGKAEEEIAGEIGSPAKLGRRLLEGDSSEPSRPVAVSLIKEQSGDCGERADRSVGSDPALGDETETVSDDGSGQGSGAGSGVGAGPGGSGGPGSGRQYTDFQKKVNEKADFLADRLLKPDPNSQGRALASMVERFFAWMLDLLLVFAFSIVLSLFFWIVVATLGKGYYNGIGHWLGEYFQRFSHLLPDVIKNLVYDSFPVIYSGVYMFSLLMIGGVSVFSTLCIWLTDGYTPGKWLVKIRVVKSAGGKLRFMDALFRECLIKGLANSLLHGFLNPASFLWGCLTEDHKTVQDLAAQTMVVKVRR